MTNGDPKHWPNIVTNKTKQRKFKYFQIRKTWKMHNWMMLDVATKMKQLLLDKLCDILIDQT